MSSCLAHMLTLVRRGVELLVTHVNTGETGCRAEEPHLSLEGEARRRLQRSNLVKTMLVYTILCKWMN